ncbi:MAG: hypothetical protein DWH91_10780 [Planctomycetota bacterium]|nr:MAG: hypothetical protein DWH91_10780 [Planctomycetota bacterium]
MMGGIAAILAVLGAALGGRALYALFERVLGKDERPRPSAEIWGLSILLGMGFTSAAAFVWSDLGRPLNARISWIQMIGGALCGLFAIFQHQRRNRVIPAAPYPHSTALVRACQILLGLTLLAAVVQTLLTPQRFWDERAIFAIKARVLHETQSIDAEELRHPDFVQYHPRYPMMLPLLERHVYALAGEFNDRWSKIWFPAMYLGLVLSYAGVLSRRYSADWGWLMALLLALIPVLMPDEYGFLSAQADAPMACFHGVAVLCLWDALQDPPGTRRRRGIILASSVASGAFFVKDEGTAYIIIDLIAWGLTAILCGGRIFPSTPEPDRSRSLMGHLLGIVVFGVFAAILLTPWMRHRATLPTTTEMHYWERLKSHRLLEQLATLQWSIPHLLHRMFAEWQQWGLSWWLLILAVVTAPRRAIAGPQLFLLLNLLGALAAFVVAGMLAPAELKEHLGGSSHRYLMQLVPVAMLFVAAVWSPTPSKSAAPD